MSHRFRPPKQSDTQGWKVVMFLIQHGFYFDRLSVPHPNKKDAFLHPGYPDTYAEAELFVEKYREHGVPLSLNKRRKYARR